MMDTVAYYAAVLLAKIIHALPLRWVAAFGRFGGGLAYWIDGRHRRVTYQNFRRCWPEKNDRECRELAHEHFRRLGENYASAVKTSAMTDAQLRPHLEFIGAEKFLAHGGRGIIAAIGHFGNFELYARIGCVLPGLRAGATYRALKQPKLESLVRRLRDTSGCLFFERRRDGHAMRAALREGGLVLGLLCDLHGGRKGLSTKFFGHECTMTPAPALFAMRYDLPLHPAICFRVALAHWRIEVGDEIPTRKNGERREVADIMADVNAAFEVAVRRDPPNWFWVHDRWRFMKRERKRREAQEAAASEAAEKNRAQSPG
jgi:KDO2-lipid IV(A) lauroyltransferase